MATRLRHIAADWHPHVAAIIRVGHDAFTRNASTGLLRHATETAFYVANRPIAATHAAEAIRAHWRIEATSHYSRDVTMGEDRSRIRSNPGVFATPSAGDGHMNLPPTFDLAPRLPASPNARRRE